MASGKVNSLNEMLSKIAKEFVDAQAAPDVSPDDMAWLVQMQTAVLAKMREPIDNANPNNPMGPGSAAPPMPGGAPPGAPPELAGVLGAPDMGGMGGAGAPPPPLPVGAGPMARPAPPNPDELRRILEP